MMKEGQINSKMPLGIKLILWLQGFGIFGELSILIDKKTYPLFFGPFSIAGMSVRIIHVVYFVVALAIFYGILKKYSWARTVAIVYSLYSLFITAIDVPWLFTRIQSKYMFLISVMILIILVVEL